MWDFTVCRLAVLLNILFMTVIHCVRITKVDIPVYYLIENNESQNLLVLDCEYEVQESEVNGLVIKWMFQDEIIYQWIPHHRPHVLRAHMKEKIDISYKASSKPYEQYRALALINPTWNSTGTYTCLADTFESTDRKSAFLQVIDRSKLKVEIDKNVVNDVEEISCNASNIYPQPFLNLTLNGEVIPPITNQVQLLSDGLFYVKTVAATPLLDAETEGEIICHLYFPKTNFTWEEKLLLSGTNKLTESTTLLISLMSMMFVIFNF